MEKKNITKKQLWLAIGGGVLALGILMSIFGENDTDNTAEETTITTETTEPSEPETKDDTADDLDNVEAEPKEEPATDPDTEFKNKLAVNGITDPNVQDAAVDLGHEACELFKTRPFEQTVLDLAQIGESEDVDSEMTGTVIGAAVIVYCPEYTNDMDRFIEKYGN